MTNQDAIKVIKTAIAEVEWEYPMEYAAAFDRAIEALEQKLCGDAISRESVLKLFATHDGKYLYEAIQELPPVQPEPKTEVLDKIRADIELLPSYAAKFAGGASAIHIDKEKVLRIIDKYKAESEE
jgi:hypothetical protein